MYSMEYNDSIHGPNLEVMDELFFACIENYKELDGSALYLDELPTGMDY